MVKSEKNTPIESIKSSNEKMTEQSKLCPPVWSEKLNKMLDGFFKEATGKILNKIILDTENTSFYEYGQDKQVRLCHNRSWRDKWCEIIPSDSHSPIIILEDALFLSTSVPSLSKHALLKWKDWKRHLFINWKETNNLDEFAELLTKRLSSSSYECYKCPGEHESLKNSFNFNQNSKQKKGISHKKVVI